MNPADSRAAAIVWMGIALLLILLVGAALLGWVSRRAKQLTRRRDAPRPDVKDIWFLNPPEKRKRDQREP